MADFYCEAHNLVVEADGRVHLAQENIEHDPISDEWMIRNGLLLVRLPEDEIINATSLALKRIERVIFLLPREKVAGGA